MRKVNELSPKDKKLLQSFDISMFKSAVAYIQSNRYNSCQPTLRPEGKSPGQAKKPLRHKELPLFPMESRIAVLSKKYGSDSYAVRTKYKTESRGKIVEIFNYKSKPLVDYEAKHAGSILTIDENIFMVNRKQHARRNSQVFKVDN